MHVHLNTAIYFEGQKNLEKILNYDIRKFR